MSLFISKAISNVTAGIDTKLSNLPYILPNTEGVELPHLLLRTEDVIPKIESYWYVRATVVDAVDWTMTISSIITKGEDLSGTRVDALDDKLEKIVEACIYKDFYANEEFTTNCAVLGKVYNRYLLMRENENCNVEMLDGIKTEAFYVLYEILATISRALSELLEKVARKAKAAL